MKPIALVVDDEPHICELLSITLERMDIATRTCLDITSAKQALGEQAFDLCLTDMRLPDGDGLELVEWLQREVPGTPVAVITAHGSVEAAVRALKLGAFDFVSKPLDLNDLRKLVTAALKLKGAAVPRNSATDGLVGESPPLGARACDGRQGGPEPSARAHLGRVRHRQGAGGAHDSRDRPAARRPVRADQLRSDSDRAHGKRVLRP